MIYQEIIPHAENLPYKLGRHIYHDSCSLSYGFDTTGLSIVDVEHKRFIPVLDQGQTSSCTGNAGIGAINTDPFPLNTHYSPDENGALVLYSDAEKIDGGQGYPPEDAGSHGLSIAKALVNAKVISGYQHTFTLNDALMALSKYPVIVGINWYSDMFNPDSDGRVHPTGNLSGGHEIEAFKVDITNGRVWFYNSWGPNWGVNGTFYLTWADFATLLAQRGDVTVLLPNNITPPTPMPTYKHFTMNEPTGNGHTFAELDPTLRTMLDNARDFASVPFIITSGVRTVAENIAAGGVPSSEHLIGLGADILCTDITRFAIVQGALKAGFTRIECAPNHVHLGHGKEPTYVQNWLGVALKD